MRVGAISFLPGSSQREPSLPPIQVHIHIHRYKYRQIQIHIHTSTKKQTKPNKNTNTRKCFFLGCSQQESSLNPLQCRAPSSPVYHCTSFLFSTSISCCFFALSSCPPCPTGRALMYVFQTEFQLSSHFLALSSCCWLCEKEIICLLHSFLWHFEM